MRQWALYHSTAEGGFWAIYHHIASLGDGTSDTDGWLTMTVHDGGFKHTAQKAEHISKGSVLALYSGGWSLWFSSPALVPCLSDILANVCTITYLTRWKERGTIMFIPELVGSLRDREVAYSASDRQGSNFESCVWRTVSSQSSHHPQEVLLAQFSLYVHKGGLKPDSFHFITRTSA